MIMKIGKNDVLVDDDFIVPEGCCIGITKGYARLYSTTQPHKFKAYLHRYLMQATSCQSIDHIDGNKLNNQKSNLRFCTNSQNQANRKMKGYSWNLKDKKWRAKITINHKQMHLGSYNTEAEAKEAYNQAKIKYYGDFARI